MKDDVLLWLEKSNPFLVPKIDSKASPVLEPGKRVPFEKETECLIVEGVDRVCYKSALDAGIKVLLVEENAYKISALLKDPTFEAHENLYVAENKKEQLLQVLRSFAFKRLQYVGDLSVVRSFLGGVEMSLSEYRELGKDVLPNIVNNLLHVKEYVDGRDLAGALEGEEALVCGSGISFSKTAAAIKATKRRPYIFAVGSALPKLTREGITPDFFVCVDPYASTELCEALSKLPIPVFYQHRAAKNLLFAHKGPKIYMGSSRGWPIEDALMKEMGRENFSFDAGYHAGNFGAHIALSLGCKKVVLAGIDGVAKSGEEISKKVEGVETRGDLYFGLDFFRELQENFSKAELLHFSDGFVYDQKAQTEVIVLNPKGPSFVLPESQKIDQKRVQEVINDYFNHGMLSEVEAFFKKVEKEGSKTSMEAKLLLAEFASQPLYRTLMEPLWQVWKQFIPDDSMLAPLTFYYEVLKAFSGKSGFKQDTFIFLGEREGPSTRKDKNGTVRWSGYFFDGREEGNSIFYDEEGKTLTKMGMKEGLRHGPYKNYADGKLVRKGEFFEGKAHGEHLCFKDGKVVESVCFNHGRKYGTHVTYADDGGIISKIVYGAEGFFDRFDYERAGRIARSAVWKDGYFTETLYEGREVFSKRVGKLEDGKMIFLEGV